MSWHITFEIIGKHFDPTKINIAFNKMNLPTDIAQIGRFKGKEYGYGSASYVVPKEFSRVEMFNHLSDLFEPLLEELKKHGAEEWWIDIGRFYTHQCNEELAHDELIQISRLKCSLSYSAYLVPEEEIDGCNPDSYRG